jgi:hypothetical protein
MARPVNLTKALAAASATIVAASQAVTIGTPMTLAANPVILDTQRRVLITYPAQAVAGTVLVIGTNAGGAQISETVPIPTTGAGSVATQQDFQTVTSVVPTAGVSGAVSVGTNAVGSTPWVILNNQQSVFNVDVAAALTGTATYSIEFALASPLAPVALGSALGGIPSVPPVPVPFSPTGFSGLTATLNPTNYTNPVSAVRATITAGNGSVAATFLQSGIRD